MRSRLFFGVLLVASVVAVSSPVVAQVPDAWTGTWKLNLAKSKYEPANLAPKSQTVKTEAVAGGGMKVTTDAVDAQGKATHQEVTTMFDGKPADLRGAADANTTRVYRRIDNRNWEFVTSVGGKVTTTTHTVIAADGKSRTNTTTGKNAQGVTVNNVAVYEKQ